MLTLYNRYYSFQTGPKGVIRDYQRFKQLERERREEQKDELAKLTKKFSITCRTNVSIEFSRIVYLTPQNKKKFNDNNVSDIQQADDDRAKSEEEKLDDELAQMMDETCIQDFVQRRMQVSSQSCGRFGAFLPFSLII